jgi:hypothetical protein
VLRVVNLSAHLPASIMWGLRRNDSRIVSPKKASVPEKRFSCRLADGRDRNARNRDVRHRTTPRVAEYRVCGRSAGDFVG